jgi:glutamate--cysteine ligase
LLDFARAALDSMDVRDAKGRTEARFLDQLEPLVDQGRSPGDDAVDMLGDAPGRSPRAQHDFVRAFHFAGAFG